MKILMKKILTALFLLSCCVSCTNDFESINTNRDEPTQVAGNLLLPTVIFDLATLSVGETYGFGEIISQYGASYEYNQLDIYNWTSDARFWGLYRILQNVKDIKNYGLANDLPNYEAVGLILEAYCYSILADAYGDVPYAESNRAEEGIIAPAYDSQESIYNGLLAALEEANSIIDTDSGIEGDRLYGGDMMKWKKWGNALHLRLLMRISEVRNVSADLQKIVDGPDTYPLFESNDEEAIYHYSGINPDISPVSVGVGREYEYYLGIPTTHLVNTLLKNDDPRINEWLDEKVNDDGSLEFIGVDPGQNLGDIGRPDAFCRKDESYFSDPAKINAVFLSYSEQAFILAEAAERDMINGDAKNYYETAVAASFEQWGVAMPADFLTDKAPYEAGNLGRIYEQKWLALYHSGVESWFDWKRTGQPAFIQAGPGNVNNGRVPVRLMYPSLEQSVNAANYQDASARIGGDNINSRVWWDK